MRSFGPVEFELMLLRRMADYQPALVEDAVGRLGLSLADARAAHRRWQAMVRSATFPGGNARYRLVLGRPVTAAVRDAGDLRVEVTRWAVRLWPDLCFETIALAGGPVLHEWLVRPDPSTAPRIRSVADLRPWECVVGDVERSLGPVEHADDGTPSRWSTVVTARGPDGPRRCVARFTWGLLQIVEPLPPAGLPA